MRSSRKTRADINLKLTLLDSGRNGPTLVTLYIRFDTIIDERSAESDILNGAYTAAIWAPPRKKRLSL